MAAPQSLERVVAVANGKGGVGKTTVACNVAGLAAAAGWRVLLVDLDPQGNDGHLLGYRWEGLSDDGRHLVMSLSEGTPVVPQLRQVRPNLDVVAGGEALDTLEDVLTGRVKRGREIHRVFADALAPTADDYDLVIIDTPPTRPVLLRLALGAARWIVVPTRPGRTSIEGLRALATEISLARDTNPSLELLGALLYDVETGATTIRRRALEDITAALGGAAPVFTTVVRHALAPACESEEKGLLIHEIAERANDAEPYWKALQEGRKPTRVLGSAPALAEDLALVTQEILTSIDAREQATAVSA
jgi:chromosome partitioning protein